MRAEELMVADKVYWGDNAVMFVWDIHRTDKTIIGTVDERFIPEELQHFFEVVGGLSKGFVSVDPSDLKPIPLTAEILERNGIRYQYGMPWYQGGADGVFEFRYRSDDDTIEIRKAIRYVHELQHILKESEIDKKIEL